MLMLFYYHSMHKSVPACMCVCVFDKKFMLSKGLGKTGIFIFGYVAVFVEIYWCLMPPTLTSSIKLSIHTYTGTQTHA